MSGQRIIAVILPDVWFQLSDSYPIKNDMFEYTTKNYFCSFVGDTIHYKDYVQLVEFS